MMSGEKRPTILDGGVLIALAAGERTAGEISDEISSGTGVYMCTELAMTEMTYIICRKAGWDLASDKARRLAKSSAIKVIPTELLWSEAARIKCKVPIALPDCFTVAAARITHGSAVFVRRETELVDAIDRDLLPDKIRFLEPTTMN